MLYHATLDNINDDGASGSETFEAFPGDIVSYSFPTIGMWSSEVTWNITDSDGIEQANGDADSTGFFIA